MAIISFFTFSDCKLFTHFWYLKLFDLWVIVCELILLYLLWLDFKLLVLFWFSWLIGMFEFACPKWEILTFCTKWTLWHLPWLSWSFYLWCAWLVFIIMWKRTSGFFIATLTKSARTLLRCLAIWSNCFWSSRFTR